MPGSADARKKSNDKYANIYEIPFSLNIKKGTTLQDYMKYVFLELQTVLVSAPRISFLDENGDVTRENLEFYKRYAAKEVVKEQKWKLTKYNKNNDDNISLEELAFWYGYEYEDVVNLYNTMQEHGISAEPIFTPLVQKLKGEKIKHFQPKQFADKIIPLFIALDLNKDKKVDQNEIQTPEKKAFAKIANKNIAKFEAYLSLSENKNKTSLEEIHHSATKAFNTLDVLNRDKVLDDREMQIYRDANLPKPDCDRAAMALNSDNAYTYFLGVHRGSVIAPVNFNNHSYEETNVVEVNIEKQKTPLNLVLFSTRNTVWSIKGDTPSIKKILSFAPARAFSDDVVFAGIQGVEKDKVSFADYRKCFSVQLPHKNFTQYENNVKLRKIRGITKKLSGTYPHLIKAVTEAEAFQIKTAPEINVQMNATEQNKPKNIKEIYWKEFLKWRPGGYRELDDRKIVTNAYVYNPEYKPYWLGAGQLESEGVIELLDVSKEKKRAVFLVKKDMKAFPAQPLSYSFSFILDHKDIKLPTTSLTQMTRNVCVMTRDGEPVINEDVCKNSDLLSLKPKVEEKPSGAVYVSLPKTLPVFPDGKRKLRIKLDIDNERCAKAYHNKSADKCVFNPEKSQKSPSFVGFDITPRVEGELSWANGGVLEFAPHQEWTPSQIYGIRLNLDGLGVSSNVSINGEREAKANFHASPVKITADNLEIKADPENTKEKLLYVDISTNYEIDSLRATLFHIGEGAVKTDDRLHHHETYKKLKTNVLNHVNDEGYTWMGQLKLNGNEAKLEIKLPKDEEGLKPTHLLLNQAELGKFPIGETRAVWLPLFAKEEKLPENAQAFIKKAIQGNAFAQRKVGKAYFEDLSDRRNEEKSVTHARSWLEKSARQGDVPAMAGLCALNYQYRDSTLDPSIEAYYWCNKAAEKGNADAQYMMGILYAQKTNSFYDLSKKIYWLNLAAAQDHTRALNELGITYETMSEAAQEPDQNDDKKAKAYYEKAMSLGDAYGMANLSRLYYKGLGTKASLEASYTLARRAFLNGKRNDQNTNSVAGYHIAGVLLEKYKPEKDYRKRAAKIKKHVFHDFKEPYMRAWVAFAISRYWQGKPEILEIANKIATDQAKITPNIPEVVYTQIHINLESNYYIGDQYEPNARDRAIEGLEKLQKNGYFDLSVASKLNYLYLSKRDYKRAKEHLRSLKWDRYFTTDELSNLNKRFIKKGTRITGSMRKSEDPADQRAVAKYDREQKENVDKDNKWHLEQVRKNPKHAWTHGNYASFLLHRMDDYDGAIKYGQKALSLMDYGMARQVVGTAYLAKASQLFKNKQNPDEVEKYIKKAKQIGLSTSGIKSYCGNFCDDIRSMFKAYEKDKSKKPI